MNIFQTLFLLATISLAGPALGQSTGPVHLPPPAVVPPTTASEGDIRDINGPISIPYPWLWEAYAAGAVILAGGLYVGWRLLRRHARARAKQPFELALERLERARVLMTPGTAREYAILVSEIIRLYIEQRFHEKAAHRTTEEFLSDLVQSGGAPLTLHRERLDIFLSYCDLTKFARWNLSVPDMESMHESARVFILDTRTPPSPSPASSILQPELTESK